MKLTNIFVISICFLIFISLFCSSCGPAPNAADDLVNNPNVNNNINNDNIDDNVNNNDNNTNNNENDNSNSNNNENDNQNDNNDNQNDNNDNNNNDNNQQRTKNWAIAAGGTYSDEAEAIACLPDGSIVITGRFHSTITFGEGSNNEITFTANGNSYDTFLAKYNSEGNFLWAEQLTGGGDIEGYDICSDSSGNIIVTGRFAQTLTAQQKSVTSSGDFDVFIAKYDSEGNLQWLKHAGSDSDDGARAVICDSNNAIIICGYFSSTANFGEGDQVVSLASPAMKDIFIAKYNADGQLLWAKSATSLRENYGLDLCVLPDNSIVMSGEIEATVTFGEGSNRAVLWCNTERNMFIARYDSEGNLLWAKQAKGWESIGHSVAYLSDNSIVVVGAFESDITFGSGEENEISFQSAGKATWDGFIAKYNLSGQLIWAKQIGDEFNDYIVSVCRLNDDAFVVTGYFYNITKFLQADGSELQLNSADQFSDIYLAKYDNDGNLQWIKQGYGRDVDFSTEVCCDNQSNIYITGFIKKDATFWKDDDEQTTLNAISSDDAFVAKYSE